MLRQMAEKLLGGVVIGVFAAVALFARVGDQPRLWDVLMDRFAPQAAGPSGPSVIWADGERPTNRMMVTADSSFAPVAAGAPAASSGSLRAATVAATSAPAPTSSWQRHLSGVLQMFDITGPASEHSSASVSAASSAGSAPAAAASPYAGGVSAAVASAGRPGVADASASAYVSYGNASRSDIMSSASGPVYNFSGKRR